MKSFNIYLTGVGGQGIGMLSEIILRAADHSGQKVKGVDTHGLAQRGGIVVSRIRVGENSFSPLIVKNGADLAVALERHEALRSMNDGLKDGGVLTYYDAVWQPLEVRLKQAAETSADVIRKECEKRGITLYRVFEPDLEDSRSQNIVLLAHLCRNGLVPGVETRHYRRAMDDLMTGGMLQYNLDLFNRELEKAAAGG